MNWRLTQVQPDVWQWIKYDEDFAPIAAQGSEEWERDVEICEVTH